MTQPSTVAARIATIFLLLFALSLWTPVASNAQDASADTITARTDLEAWYYVADDSAGGLPAPLPAAPDPVNPYGENTLHTSITGGQEDTRTYVLLDMGELPATFELVEGMLTLPIDPGGVTVNPAEARVQICLATPPSESVEGSFEEPPDVDCADKVPATYEEQPFPHLTADITDLGTDLVFSALAIMPSDRAKEQQDTWHLTFYGKDNETEGARPISAELTIEALVPIIDFGPGDGDDDGSFDTDFDTGGGGTGDFGSTGSSSGFDFDTSTGPALDTRSAPNVVAQEEGDEPTEATQTELPEGLELAAEEGDPPYSVVWALPLLLVAFVTYFSSALTRDIVLRRGSS